MTTREPSPFRQGLTIGAGTGAGVLAVAILAAVAARWAWWVPVLAGLVGALLGFALGAILLTLDARRLLWTVEAGTGFDLDRDSYVGRPPDLGCRSDSREHDDPRLIYVRDPRAQRRQDTTRDFRHWLREVYQTGDATRRTWEGARLPSGAEVTRDLWDAWTDRLLRAGLAERPYGTAGLELRGDYQAALVAFREVL